MQPIKVMTIFGTRPEAIKMAPLILAMQQQPEHFKSIVTVTAQHRQMLDQVLEIFQLSPDYDLNIMKERQTLSDITSNALLALDDVLKEAQPDIVLVHGDTSTTFAASLSAFYQQIPVGHVEAGLRTWQKYTPFPEEMNRQLTDVLSDLYFAPTPISRENLLKENHPADQIFITGNTAIDALAYTVQSDYQHELLASIPPEQRIILVTMHRRENQGAPMTHVFQAIRRIAAEYPDTEIIFPVHLNPVVQEAAAKTLGEQERIHLIAPLDVVDFHNFAKRSYFVMSDSGGVQEEAPSLNVPVLVLRDTTERPEGLETGALKLAGTNEQTVYQLMTDLLTNPALYKQMAEAANPYGDGRASQRILAAIAYYLGRTTQRPADFGY